MAAPNKPIELYFTSPIYARGEHVIGENAVKDDGRPNMILIPAGATKRLTADAARDLIIAKQAIDAKASTSAQMDEAREIVREKLSRTNKKAA